MNRKCSPILKISTGIRNPSADSKFGILIDYKQLGLLLLMQTHERYRIKTTEHYQ